MPTPTDTRGSSNSDEDQRDLERLARMVIDELELRLKVEALRQAELRFRLRERLSAATADAADFDAALSAMLRMTAEHVGADSAFAWSLAPGADRCELGRGERGP